MPAVLEAPRDVASNGDPSVHRISGIGWPWSASGGGALSRAGRFRRLPASETQPQLPDLRRWHCVGERARQVGCGVPPHSARTDRTSGSPSCTQEKFAFTVFARTFKEIWAAAGDPDGQRGTVCVRACPLWPQQALGLVVAVRHPDRAHPTRPSATKRAARTHASHVEKGSDEAGAAQRAAAASPLRCLRRPLQSGAAPPGVSDEGARRRLCPLAARVLWPSGPDVSLSRSDCQSFVSQLMSRRENVVSSLHAPWTS
jgi:hypothetical protein